MNYENKEYILQFFEGVHEEENRAELEKVYAIAERVSKYLKDLDFLERNLNECLTKAEAFDAILKAYEEASHEGQMVYEFSNIIEKYERGDKQ